MKVLLDLNVLLDVVLNRQPWVDESKQVWDASQSRAFEGFVVATGLTNLFYIVRRQADRDRARTAVRTCLASFEFIAVDQQRLREADSQTGADFEDNVSVACAVSAGMDAIVTRNPADFTHSAVPVLTPTELLQRLADPGTTAPQPTTGP
jgi:predicted nucleic acid-binding protein